MFYCGSLLHGGGPSASLSSFRNHNQRKRRHMKSEEEEVEVGVKGEERKERRIRGATERKRSSPFAGIEEEARIGLIIEFCSAWLRPQETHLLAVRRSIVKTLDPRLQELLGYNLAPPFIGYVNGRHPRRVIETWKEDSRKEKEKDS